MSAPTVGIFGLTGCAGDQLVILNCEDELLDIVGALDIRDFLMASSHNDEDCDLDIALVEGAVLSRRNEETLKRIRERAGMLIAIGTCAVWGGVAAMDRRFQRDELLDTVYGEAGKQFDTTPARALHEVVKVDGAITGCPIEKHEVIAAISHLLNGNPPLPVTTPVCAECRMNENNCLLVEKGIPCLGMVTAGGCHARCPSLGVPCVGCRGPAEDANVASALALLETKGYASTDAQAKLATFAPISNGGGKSK
jgi:coenzyme F420-reducing hydrogenase gamma subunit